MTAVKTGDKVRIHYIGTLLDGTRFDSSESRQPLEFEVGSGQVIAGLDVALPGMVAGEKKTVTAPCKEAYGPIDPGQRQAVPRSAIPDDVPLELGMRLQMQNPDGQILNVRVVDLDEEQVTLDANHALAGMDLFFAIELVSINAG
jgi:FKBP-type peptidyl-prolyl cis-trans isomerase 2